MISRLSSGKKISEASAPVEDPKLYYLTEAYEYRVESTDEQKESKKEKPKPRRP